MAMNYCDYYMNTLSVYISTRQILPFDLWYFIDMGQLYIWYPGVEYKTIVLYLKSDSRKLYPPVECMVEDYTPHRNLMFFYDSIITKNRKIPIGYKLEVNL